MVRVAGSRSTAEPSGRSAAPAAAATRPQFGSRPWTAALSRLLETTARATARASARSAAPVTRQVMRVVAPSPSAACWRASERQTAVRAAPSWAASELPGRGDSASEAPEARTKTVSLVDVSPSTLVCSKVAADASRRSAASSSGIGGGVGQDDRDHGRHPGMDHAHALGDAGDAHLAEREVVSRQGDGRRRRLAPRVGGHDRRPERFPAAAVRLEVRLGQEGDPVADPVNGQPGADQAGRRGQRLHGVDPERRRERQGDGGLVVVTGRSGRRVGAAAGHDHGADAPAGLRQVSAAEADGRGLDEVGGEDRRRRGGLRTGHDDQAEVRATAGLDARAEAPGEEAGRQLGPFLDPRAAHSRCHVEPLTDRGEAGRGPPSRAAR